MTCGLSPKQQTNSGKRKNSRLLFSRQTPVPRDPRHENLRRQPAPAKLQQEIEMCVSIINVSVMLPENAYSLALSRETTEPASIVATAAGATNSLLFLVHGHSAKRFLVDTGAAVSVYPASFRDINGGRNFFSRRVPTRSLSSLMGYG